jgi:hypothetical protein
LAGTYRPTPTEGSVNVNPLLNESPSSVPTGTWRRLGVLRAIAGSAAALALLGAAAGTAFALTSRAGADAAPASSPSTAVSPTTPAAKSPTRSAPAPDAHAPTGAAPSARAAAPPPAPVYQGIQDEELRPKGLHPYRLGDRFTNLQSQGLLKVVGESATCDWIGARGLTQYHEPFMTFFRGTMVSLIVDSPDVPTFNGAHVGMSLAQVQGRHPAGRKLTRGDQYAWLVTERTYALMFRFDHGGIVESIVAGHARGLELQFTDGGEGC